LFKRPSFSELLLQ